MSEDETIGRLPNWKLSVNVSAEQSWLIEKFRGKSSQTEYGGLIC